MLTKSPLQVMVFDLEFGQPAVSTSLPSSSSLDVNMPYTVPKLRCRVIANSQPHSALPLQVVVFDLEFGQPAASTSLPSSRPPFCDVLGCFGHQAVGKDVSLGGIDLLYCSHQVDHS